MGDSLCGFDPKTATDSNCIVVWGANPSASAPHFHEHWLVESPAKIVVIDPVLHDTARAADIHLRPFPGTDAALAFAIAHVLERDHCLDDAFIEHHTIGFSELRADIRRSTPQWAEHVTGVAAGDIEQVAHLYDMQHPGVIRLLQTIFRAADKLKIPVAVCGEAAGNRRYTRLLLALGLKEFSMHTAHLLEVKKTITETHIPRARAGLTQWLNEPGDQRGLSLLQFLDQSQLTS